MARRAAETEPLAGIATCLTPVGPGVPRCPRRRPHDQQPPGFEEGQAVFGGGHRSAVIRRLTFHRLTMPAASKEQPASEILRRT
jgi:hypothetical protein